MLLKSNLKALAVAFYSTAVEGELIISSSEGPRRGFNVIDFGFHRFINEKFEKIN